MPTLTYQSAGFTGNLAALNGGGDLNCTWAQLAWAAITVGKAFNDEIAFGIFSVYERIHRATMIYAYLMESPSGYVLRSAPYLAADPSEKGNISYSLGMTLAKLYSEVALATPRLLHYATYPGGYAITTAPGASRPDLIGLTATGQWVVFEAKGRSNGLEAGVVAAAKLQSQQILTIDGEQPICRVGLAAYFSPTGLAFSLEDPPAKGDRKVEISQPQFIARYDGALRRLVETRTATRSKEVYGHVFVGADFPEADLFLAMDEGTEPRGRMVSETAYLGTDGLLVETGPSWSQERMRRQPQLR